MARYLFCLPRYHTNAVPWTSILMAAGHMVSMDVLLKGPTENHALLQPAPWKPGRLSRMLPGLRGGGAIDLYAFPDLAGYWRHMRALDPDVVIVRGVTRRFCRVAALFAVLQRRRLVIYDQEDVVPRRWSGTWIRRAVFQLLRIPHITSRLADITARPPAAGDAIPVPFGCPMGEARSAALARRPLAWPPRLLMVAKYRERKGHGLFLEALAQIAPERQFTVTFCGEEASDTDIRFREELQAKGERLGLSGRLQFLKNIPHAEMDAIYAAHDLFVLPSRHEPAAVSPIEAAWAGCAVVISRDSGTRGYIPPGKAYDFNAQSVDDLARALQDILVDGRHLTQMRNACRAHIENVASETLILNQFEALLQSRAGKRIKPALETE
jgi:glycosyltransferase involved in cell wall biosynthesis